MRTDTPGRVDALAASATVAVGDPPEEDSLARSLEEVIPDDAHFETVDGHAVTVDQKGIFIEVDADRAAGPTINVATIDAAMVPVVTLSR